jgi:hypothetical protein
MMSVRADGNPRRVIPATCSTHRGTPGYTNLVVSNRDGNIELDPHVDGSCLITLDEDGARMLFEALREWLG